MSETQLLTEKTRLLAYLRERALEHLAEANREFGKSDYKKKAQRTNKLLNEERQHLVDILDQTVQAEAWDQATALSSRLLLMHCVNAVMLETRNEVWPYEYMAFSRRIGELWEPFVTTCFTHSPRNDVRLFAPPVFSDVKSRLVAEVREFIERLEISEDDKNSLLNYYDQIWQLVSSGEIQLKLDSHFRIGDVRYCVDCKSGFGSNEKGNTNRLLLVASIFKNIEPQDYRCILLVRSAEDENNNYLQTLKASGLWDVHCGDAAYPKVNELSGFDLGAWARSNIDWPNDLAEDFHQYLQENDLEKYLSWSL